MRISVVAPTCPLPVAAAGCAGALALAACPASDVCCLEIALSAAFCAAKTHMHA